jgi:hypothetical protein
MGCGGFVLLILGLVFGVGVFFLACSAGIGGFRLD